MTGSILFRIQINGAAAFSAADGETILEAGQREGLQLPYSCRTGRCNTCKCKVVSGNTVALKTELGLTTGEQMEGWILSCSRAATSDLELSVDGMAPIELPKPRLFPVKIDSLEFLAPDVIKVGLRLQPGIKLDYVPGQFIDVLGADGKRRSYSIAGSGTTGDSLDLHIRKLDGGLMSTYWFESAKINDLLRLRGPYGTFFVRAPAGRELIFLATGTGIAPVVSMLNSVTKLPPSELPKSVTVLWGGRQRSDLYLDLAHYLGNAEFVPVLSRGDPDWEGARGYVQDVLLGLRNRFDDVDVYACGSDAMIRSARTALVGAGLGESRFFSDAFVCSTN